MLRGKRCVLCEGGTKSLATGEIAEYFQVLTAWQVEGDKKFIKTYRCRDFAETLAFVNTVGAIAEMEGHHPDINLLGWNKVAITLSTCAIGRGVHE